LGAEVAPAPIPVFRRIRRVRPRDLDPLGHVNNAVWVRFVVELAGAHSEAVGLGLDAVRRLGGVWVVKRHQLDYHHPAGPGAEILEETWVSRMNGARSVRHSRLRLARGGRLLLSATTDWAFVDPESGRPRRLPAAVLERFTPLERPPEP
jgi:acyl-CoA thioester hydrolase